MQDVIITSGGKNIAPHPIEQRIKTLLPDFIRYIHSSNTVTMLRLDVLCRTKLFFDRTGFPVVPAVWSFWLSSGRYGH